MRLQYTGTRVRVFPTHLPRSVQPAAPYRVGIAVLLALALYLAVRCGSEGSKAPTRCTVVSGKGDEAVFHFAPEQAANAATIAVVGTSRGMPERTVTIALATALQATRPAR